MQHITLKIKLVIFGVIDDSLHIFLTDKLLPATYVVNKVLLDKQVEKLFSETTGHSLKNNYSEQLYTISNDNDEVNIVYFILLPLLSHDKKFEASWTRVSTLLKAMQDKDIIAYAVQRLRWKVEYTNVVYSLLPNEFTLSELQKTYEAILGQILDKRNFRKKMLSLHFLKQTGKRRTGISRPAQLYTFKSRQPELVKIFS